MKADLNIDLGEKPGEPAELYALATRVNVACGGHAGDEASMRLACRLAKAAETKVGAHPSYEDRAHFGRRPLDLPPEQVAESVVRQIRALALVAGDEGISLSHVKLHGALYHDAARHPELAETLVQALCLSIRTPPLVGPPEGALREAAERAGIEYLPEGFADRRYEPDGTLVSRTRPDALITNPDEAAAQALSLARSGRFRTLCLHSDTEGAVAIARAVRRALEPS